MFLTNTALTHLNHVTFVISSYCRFQLKRFALVKSNARGKENRQYVTQTLNVPGFLRIRRSDFRGFYSFVVDDGVADAIAEEVMKSVKKVRKANVYEINPGMGKITKSLMEKGLEKLMIFDPLKCKLCKEIIKKFKQKIQVVDVDNKRRIFNHPDQVFPSDFELNSDQPTFIIGVNINRKFIRRLIERVVLIDATYLQNQEFYFLLSEDIYNCFEDMYERNSTVHDYAFMDLVFEVESLATFPRSAVLPPALIESKNMHFLRLQRKIQCDFTENFINYFNFLNILRMRKTQFLISVLEKWFPECGTLLMKNGFSKSTKVKNLTKEDFIKLYRLLQTHEHFESAMKIVEETIFAEPD